jgi:translation initiation factor 4G
MLTKRIIHRPKRPILTIERHQLKAREDVFMRTRSAPPRSGGVEVPEMPSDVNRGICLLLPDGRPITKEMLDELSVSNEEDEEFGEATITQEAEREVHLENEIPPVVEKEKEPEILEDELGKELEEQSTPKGEIEIPLEDVPEEVPGESGEVHELEEASEKESPPEVLEEEEPYVYRPPKPPIETEEQKEIPEVSLEPPRVYTLEEIFGTKERREIPLNIDPSIFKKDKKYPTKRPERRVREDTVSKFRLELNRIAWSNCEEVVENIKRLKVHTELEMKKLAEIFFEKAVSEPVFVKLYAYLLKHLSIDFRIAGEEAGEQRSVFFYTLLKQCQSTFENKEKWTRNASVVNLNELSFSERLTLDEQVQEEEIEKVKIKNRILGTVRFLSLMYTYNIINFKIINTCVLSLLKDMKDEENVETLCYLVDNCGERIVKGGKGSVIDEVCKKLEDVMESSDSRMKFVILSVLEKRKGAWGVHEEKPKTRPTISTKNTFSGLKVETISEKKKTSQEDKRYVEKIVDEVLDMDQEDRVRCIDEIKENVNKGKITKMAFSKIYLRRVIETFKGTLQYLDFYLQIHKEIKIDDRCIDDIMSGIYKEMDDILDDAPFAKKNFYVVACYLRSRKMLGRDVFFKYKDEEFSKIREDIAKEWMKDVKNDLLIERIFEGEGDIIKMVESLSLDEQDGLEKWVERYKKLGK